MDLNYRINRDVTCIANSEIETNKIISEKRQCNLNVNVIKYKREVTKQKRISGEAYIGYRRCGKIVDHNTMRSKRIMKETCSSKKCQNLKNRFCQNFDEKLRRDIFKKFWSTTTWEEKKTFVISMVANTPRKSDTTGLGDESRRSNTFIYFLNHTNTERLQVCKIMFLNTLGLNEWMVRNWIKK
ncbi:Hypothetical protein CINCED_3A011375 [Cinara cedri]|uniref:Uncharacterized protein n=1 Tax=Cinara cedri TaxID=506608 RepID=A0A5E4NL13_9HEMI|nr:Hypothetical protein CINCED_3A011375 [Cinara cedri]